VADKTGYTHLKKRTCKKEIEKSINTLHTHTIYMAAEKKEKPACPACGLRGRVRIRAFDKSLVCGDCGYDSREDGEVKKK